MPSGYITSNGRPSYTGCDLMKSILAGSSSGLGQKWPPPRAVFRRALEHRVGVAGDPNRQMRPLDRFRRERDGRTPRTSLEARRLAGPQLDDRGQILIGQPPRSRNGTPSAFEFFCVPTHSERHGDAAAAHPVGCRQRFRHHDRMLQRQDGHGRVDPNALRRTGDECLPHGQVRVVRAGEQVQMGVRDHQSARGSRSCRSRARRHAWRSPPARGRSRRIPIAP